MVVRMCGFLTSAQDPLLNETTELIKIVSKLISNSS